MKKDKIVITIVCGMMIVLLIAIGFILDAQIGKDDVPADYYPEILSPNTGTSIIFPEADSMLYTILTQVPDITTLADIKITYYTMHLYMSDGTQYVVYTDMEGNLTAIYCWDPTINAVGPVIYKATE